MRLGLQRALTRQDAHTNSASKVEVIDKAHMVVAKAAVQEFQRKTSSTRGLEKNEDHMYTWMNALGIASWSSDRIGYQHADEAGNEYTFPSTWMAPVVKKAPLL